MHLASGTLSRRGNLSYVCIQLYILWCRKRFVKFPNCLLLSGFDVVGEPPLLDSLGVGVGVGVVLGDCIVFYVVVGRSLSSMSVRVSGCHLVRYPIVGSTRLVVSGSSTVLNRMVIFPTICAYSLCILLDHWPFHPVLIIFEPLRASVL